MNVLLKGLKMPRGNNFVTIHVSADGKWCSVLETELEGEAVEVSTPHGRLIDANRLKQAMMASQIEHGIIGIKFGLSDAIRIINDALPVIEAEE